MVAYSLPRPRGTVHHHSFDPLDQIHVDRTHVGESILLEGLTPRPKDPKANLGSSRNFVSGMLCRVCFRAEAQGRGEEDGRRNPIPKFMRM